MAYGAPPVPTCDLICSPGNRYVTAAKYWVSSDVAIDMSAGPSDLVVVADRNANVEWIAADLLAQAEHDTDAQPILIALGDSLADAVRVAPEHLALHLDDAAQASGRFNHYGAMFIGASAGEVLGDYGAGPIHKMPTGGTARARGGLSVLNFLRVRMWLTAKDRRAARALYEDAVWLGDVEGLQGQARSAQARLSPEAS